MRPLFTIPQLLDRVGNHDGHEKLSLQELDYLVANLRPNKGYAFGVLPYETKLDKTIVDTIAKKLNLNKFYRGPRRARRGSICRTLKEDATGVALYRKP